MTEGRKSHDSTAGTAASRRHSDLLGDAITVLENMRVTTDPMEPWEMGDIEQRRVTALGYLTMIGTHRAEALVEYARQRTTREDVLEALDELARLVKPRG